MANSHKILVMAAINTASAAATTTGPMVWAENWWKGFKRKLDCKKKPRSNHLKNDLAAKKPLKMAQNGKW